MTTENIEKRRIAMWDSPAGKSAVAIELAAMLPEHKVYVEPFIGSGAVLFAKDKSDIEVVNDFEKEIADAYRAVKTMTPDKLKKLGEMNWRNSRERWTKLKNSSQTDDLMKLYRFLYVTRFSFCKMREGWDKDSDGKIASASAGRVERHMDRCKGLLVYDGDYEKVMRKYDGAGTVFFLDPPYSGHNAGVKESKFDEHRFYNVLKSLKGKWLLTYGIRGELPELLKKNGHTVNTFTTNRVISNAPGVDQAKKLAQIWVANYKAKGGSALNKSSEDRSVWPVELQTHQEQRAAAPPKTLKVHEPDFYMSKMADGQKTGVLSTRELPGLANSEVIIPDTEGEPLALVSVGPAIRFDRAATAVETLVSKLDSATASRYRATETPAYYYPLSLVRKMCPDWTGPTMRLDGCGMLARRLAEGELAGILLDDDLSTQQGSEYALLQEADDGAVSHGVVKMDHAVRFATGAQAVRILGGALSEPQAQSYVDGEQPVHFVPMQPVAMYDLPRPVGDPGSWRLQVYKAINDISTSLFDVSKRVFLSGKSHVSVKVAGAAQENEVLDSIVGVVPVSVMDSDKHHRSALIAAWGPTAGAFVRCFDDSIAKSSKACRITISNSSAVPGAVVPLAPDDIVPPLQKIFAAAGAGDTDFCNALSFALCCPKSGGTATGAKSSLAKSADGSTELVSAVFAVSGYDSLSGLSSWHDGSASCSLMQYTEKRIGEQESAFVKRTWTQRYVNRLPDSAFLYLAPGGHKDESGRTVQRSLRYFPYKDKDGEIDVPHLRNAIARIPQSNADGLTEQKADELQGKARDMLARVTKGDALDNSKDLPLPLTTSDASGENDPSVTDTSNEPTHAIQIIKAGELRYVLGVVLEPNDGKNGNALNPDAQNDIYSVDEIRQAAWTFMLKYRKAGDMHERTVTADEVEIVESYQMPVDVTIDGEKIVEGTWMLGAHIVSDELWKKVKGGERNAWSVDGSAVRTPEKAKS